jgi:hypothetical protein
MVDDSAGYSGQSFQDPRELLLYSVCRIGVVCYLHALPWTLLTRKKQPKGKCKKPTMTKQDFTTTENIDREKEEGKELSDQAFEVKSAGGKTRVKNAHAAGDGAFGRNEASLPEEEEAGEKKEDDPPY